MPNRSWEELAQLLPDITRGESLLWWGRADLCAEARCDHGATWKTIASAAGVSASQAALLAGLSERVPEEHRHHGELLPGVWGVLARTATPTDFCCQAADYTMSIAAVKELVGAVHDPIDEGVTQRARRKVERFVAGMRDELGAEAVEVRAKVAGEEVSEKWPNA